MANQPYGENGENSSLQVKNSYGTNSTNTKLAVEFEVQKIIPISGQFVLSKMIHSWLKMTKPLRFYYVGVRAGLAIAYA